MNKIEKLMDSIIFEQMVFGDVDTYIELTKNKKGEVIDIKHIKFEEVKNEI